MLIVLRKNNTNIRVSYLGTVSLTSHPLEIQITFNQPRIHTGIAKAKSSGNTKWRSDFVGTILRVSLVYARLVVMSS